MSLVSIFVVCQFLVAMITAAPDFDGTCPLF